jgi:hypothetical protein
VAESGTGGAMPEWRVQVQEAAGGAGGSFGVGLSTFARAPQMSLQVASRAMVNVASLE